MKTLLPALVLCVLLGGTLRAADLPAAKSFSTEKDLLSLHYDHAPDKDDGHSAAADRTILESMFGADWIKRHVVAVSGAYGKNGPQFNAASAAVMDVAWKELGGWLAGHTNQTRTVADLTSRWAEVLNAGGDVWVKEGGQSDITAAVVKNIQEQMPDLATTERIHVVQHSTWNEDQTTDEALEYTKKHTHYIRIRDANAYLNVARGNRAFERAALAHSRFGDAWKAAFAYYNPEERLDFSDTGELMHILGLGEMGIDAFRLRFLDEDEEEKVPKPYRDLAEQFVESLRTGDVVGYAHCWLPLRRIEAMAHALPEPMSDNQIAAMMRYFRERNRQVSHSFRILSDFFRKNGKIEDLMLTDVTIQGSIAEQNGLRHVTMFYVTVELGESQYTITIDDGFEDEGMWFFSGKPLQIEGGPENETVSLAERTEIGEATR